VSIFLAKSLNAPTLCIQRHSSTLPDIVQSEHIVPIVVEGAEVDYFK
jgi:hypothetical protein